MADVKGIFTTIGKTALSAVTGGISDKVLDVIQGSGLSQGAKDEIAKAREDNKQKLAELEEQTAQASVAAAAQIVTAINATMQAEAKSEHWLQWAWRPIWGLCGAALVVNNFILLPYLRGFGVVPIDVPEIVWEVILAVVGVTAFTRGLKQVALNWKTGDQKAQ